jgi:hypothetical protein
MMMEAAAILEALKHVDKEAFFCKPNRLIFEAIVSLSERGEAVDPITVTEELVASGDLRAAGGKEYISEIIDAVPTAANVKYYAKIVQEYALRRRLIEIADETKLKAAKPGAAPEEIIRWQHQETANLGRLHPLNGRRPLRLIDDAELEMLTPPQDLVAGRIPGTSIIQLFGPSATFKSFVALDLAAHIATGRAWHGHAVARGTVVYIVGEGAYGMKKRLAAWKAHNRVGGQIDIRFLPVGIPISDGSPMLAELMSEIERLPTPPILIVVDTVSRNFPGGSQNDDEAMGRFIAGLDQLKDAFGTAILAVHHTGYTEQDRSRGSSAWPAALDTEIKCQRDGDRLTLTWKKQKDDVEPDPMSFDVVKSRESLALKLTDPCGGRLDGQSLICLRALHRIEERTTFTAWRRAAGLDRKKSSFSTARNWLLERGYVEISGKKYSITRNGISALGPLVQDWSNEGPSPRTDIGPSSRGSYQDPAMDPHADASSETEHPEGLERLPR